MLLRCLAGRKTVVLQRGDEDAGEVLNRQRVTIASVVPTQLPRLGDVPTSMRAVLVGGAAAPSGLVRSLRERGWPLRLTWGMTETCSQIATQSGESAPDDLTSGHPLEGYELRVVDGALEVRTPALLDGWLEDGGIRNPLQGGWLRTGDLGDIDEEGRVTVHGRADDVIVTGGENVSPASVEARLSDMDGVSQALVFGEPDALWGEIVCVALVASGPESVVRKQLADVPLATFERPRRVAFFGSFPLLANGKVDRRQVVAEAKRRLRAL